MDVADKDSTAGTSEININENDDTCQSIEGPRERSVDEKQDNSQNFGGNTQMEEVRNAFYFFSPCSIAVVGPTYSG